MKNFVNKFKKYFKISLFEISLVGVLASLYVLLNLNFLKIDLIIMKSGLQFPVLILMGLSLKPFLAIISSVIVDNLSFLSNGGVWIWQYAIIPPAIIIITLLAKQIHKIKETKIYLAISILVIALTILAAVTLLFIYDNYSSHKSNLSTNTTKLIIISAIILLFILSVGFILWYFFTKNIQSKNALNILVVVILVVVIIVWIWGPVAIIEYLQSLGITVKSYDIYLVPRLIKGLIQIPLFTLLILPIYNLLNILKKNFVNNKW